MKSYSLINGALMIIFLYRMFLPPGDSPNIKWMNLDPVKLVKKLSQTFSLEGFKKMLDKSEVRFTNGRREKDFFVSSLKWTFFWNTFVP